MALVSWTALEVANTLKDPASARPLIHGPLLSDDTLRDILTGSNELSVGVWMILASTLMPTFLHFLVALLACVTLPFNSRNFRKTTVKLRKARREAVRRGKQDANQAADAVPVHEYARGWAMVYFFVSWPAVFVVWLILASAISYAGFVGISAMLRLLI